MRQNTLLSKLMLLLCALIVGSQISWAGTTVTYSQTSTTAVSVSNGTAPSGSSASFTTTYTSNKNQLTADNSMTLTLSGYEGKKITGIKLSMKSNSSKGSGSLSVKAGSTTIASIADAAFNNSSWYGSWSTSYVDVSVTMEDDSYVIQENENLVITIAATQNSLYCQSFTLIYEDGGSSNPFAGGDVTFTAGTDKGNSTTQTSDQITKSGVTISSTSAALAATEYRLYQNSTTTISTTSGKITKIVFTEVSNSYPLSRLSANTGLYGSGTWTGSASSIIFTASAQARASKIVVTVTPDGTVSAPSITGTTSFLGSTEVTITAETGADIYYTTDGSTPTTSSTHYSEPFYINATTTVKAIAVKDNTNSDTAEQTFTLITPIMVATALETGDNNEVYVEGIITRVTGLYSNSLTYFISDDGTENDELEIYNGKGLNGANFTSTSDLQAGDVVVVHGTLTTYNSQKELSAGSSIISLTTKADPNLSYAKTEYSVNLGESFTTPTLTNPYTLTVTYSVSDNDNVASVNASTGAVTVGSNAGTVTITASFAGDATYRAGSASYTLTVKEPNFITLAAGATVTTTSFPSFSGSGYKTLDDYQIELSSVGAKDWEVHDCMKNGDDLQMKASTGTLVSPDIRTPYGFTVTVNYTSDAAMTLSSGTDSKTGSNGSVSLDVQSTEAAFTLKTGNKFATVQSITITAKSASTATITLNAACTDGEMVYGTYSNTSAFVVSGDIIVSEIGIDSSNKLVVRAYESGDIVPANTGVMVSALNDDVAFANGTCDFTVTLSSEAGTSVLGTDNCLHPSGDAGIDAAGMASAAPSCLYYRLTMHNGTEIGYWWGANNGAAFDVAANKAYLAVPVSQARSISGFAFDEDGTTTAIEDVRVADGKNAVYNLNGQRVNNPAKGMYIVNGKKVIK